MAKVLIIGGAGFVGSHAVDLFIEKGNQVVVIDSLETGHRQSVHPAAEFIQADIRDRAILDEVFSQNEFEGVLHFAANSLVGESVTKPLKYFDNNVVGMIYLLQAMEKYGVDKIIFSSTAATYGNQDRALISEDLPANPTSPYGESKLMMEKIIDWTSQVTPIKFVSLRYFNVAGAKIAGEIGEDHRPETHLIPIVLEVALGKRPFIGVYGSDYSTPDGSCIRDYIHVTDLVEAHRLALDYLGQESNGSQIINLGSSQGYSVLEIVEAAKKVTGREIPMKVEGRRAGDPARLVASSQKARDLLNWQPEITNIEEIIDSAWQWYLKYPNGYEE